MPCLTIARFRSHGPSAYPARVASIYIDKCVGWPLRYSLSERPAGFPTALTCLQIDRANRALLPVRMILPLIGIAPSER